MEESHSIRPSTSCGQSIPCLLISTLQCQSSPFCRPGAVHEELGVEEMEDFAHVSRADLKDAKALKPVKRNKLIKCICALSIDGEPIAMEDATMCPGK